ncbi:unnamed protein product, partial [Mycena citricolor]
MDGSTHTRQVLFHPNCYIERRPINLGSQRPSCREFQGVRTLQYKTMPLVAPPGYITFLWIRFWRTCSTTMTTTTTARVRHTGVGRFESLW